MILQNKKRLLFIGKKFIIFEDKIAGYTNVVYLNLNNIAMCCIHKKNLGSHYGI